METREADPRRTTSCDGIKLYTGGWEITLDATSRRHTVRLAEVLRPLDGAGPSAVTRSLRPRSAVTWGLACDGVR